MTSICALFEFRIVRRRRREASSFYERIRSQFLEQVASGLSTNLASRLESAREPGEIYLSHATWGLIKDEIPCKEVGTIAVKGFHYPIQTYRVLQSDLDRRLDS